MIERHARRSVQAPSAVVMIRPHHFAPNSETAEDNAFQQEAGHLDAAEVSRLAHAEVSRAAEALEAVGVRTHIFEDESRLTPDSVFPNNWFSTHPGGHVAIFPMFPVTRRRERRADVIEMLKRDYRVQEVVDYSGLERDGLFLEGTGAMVLDHIDRVAYVVRSNRADPIILERFCSHFKYEPMVFDAHDARGVPVYHTNVLMCIATEFVLLGVDMMVDDARRQHILERFEESGREVVSLSNSQIADFAGNAIELQGRNGRVLALSTRALNALRPDQVAVIEQTAELLPLHVPTIELAGGSVRCMLAGVHLSRR
ncbi:citrulline utilization hydrolase CtlX [Aliiruegeria sabulilitoris]|uniref:citrulline utilization hydrolase CtlX n=1 Tax=Aliiruegeria sabulilitoris TaxID=1510458 RepID=UPI000837844B|nr:arginine deiminase-related protein [Aliiruegeria sabulilitoris]NDR57190.1 amidinotransferase [Pseudoruegeria sp. M32A2M]